MELESLKRYSDFDKLHKALRTSSLLVMHMKSKPINCLLFNDYCIRFDFTRSQNIV